MSYLLKYPLRVDWIQRIIQIQPLLLRRREIEGEKMLLAHGCMNKLLFLCIFTSGTDKLETVLPVIIPHSSNLQIQLQNIGYIVYDQKCLIVLQPFLFYIVSCCLNHCNARSIRNQKHWFSVVLKFSTWHTSRKDAAHCL